MLGVKLFFRTLFFIIFSEAVIIVSCVQELLYGKGLTHPMWDSQYNWLPLLKTLVVISAIGSAFSIIIGQYHFGGWANIKKQTGGIIMNAKVNFYNRRLRSLELVRNDLAKKIDDSYLRDNITDFLSLESKYKDIINSIKKVRTDLTMTMPYLNRRKV